MLNKIIHMNIFYCKIISKVFIDNIRNEMLAEIQQLKNNQYLQKEMDRESKSKEVNKVININSIKIPGLLIENTFLIKRSQMKKTTFKKLQQLLSK